MIIMLDEFLSAWLDICRIYFSDQFGLRNCEKKPRSIKHGSMYAVVFAIILPDAACLHDRMLALLPCTVFHFGL